MGEASGAGCEPPALLPSPAQPVHTRVCTPEALHKGAGVSGEGDSGSPWAPGAAPRRRLPFAAEAAGGRQEPHF